MAHRVGETKEVPVQQIDVYTDTRDILAHAKRQAEERRYRDFTIFDVDSHIIETMNWHEVAEYIEDPVIRDNALDFYKNKGGAPAYGLNTNPGMWYQDIGGRIPHDSDRRETVEESDGERNLVLIRRALESIGIDYMVVFPTAMLHVGMHPQLDMEVVLSRAFNRWLVDHILKADDRLKSMLYLPFSNPEASIKMVEEFAGEPGVIGFMVTSVRNQPVQANPYMRLYATLQERGLPIAFHSGYYWQEPVLTQFSRFVGMHTVGFVLWNIVHLVNWVLHGIPERFPRLKVIWIESGLAWIPFIIQRLDHEYLLRTSEAPALKRLPSEYIREMFFSAQPLEKYSLDALEFTFKMINAESQLLYASDWPHQDFDLPSTIYDLPFLSEGAKRNILGGNALKLFNLDNPKGK